VFIRFVNSLRKLRARHAADWYVIAEYDTVNLRDQMPTQHDGKVSSCVVVSDPILPGPMQVCMLSPWVMQGETMDRFIDAAGPVLRENPDYSEGGGLLDRWVGHVCVRAEIPFENCDNALGYPWHRGAHERIRRMGFAWVHGWKTIEEFGDLWNETL
jgi:hypothetical protein